MWLCFVSHKPCKWRARFDEYQPLPVFYVRFRKINQIHMFSYVKISNISGIFDKKRFIRLMHRWTRKIKSLEWLGEKNRLGGGSNLGWWGEICASGAPNDYFRSSETPFAATHCLQEPTFLPSVRTYFFSLRACVTVWCSYWPSAKMLYNKFYSL